VGGWLGGALHTWLAGLVASLLGWLGGNARWGGARGWLSEASKKQGRSKPRTCLLERLACLLALLACFLLAAWCAWRSYLPS